jgi:hypothetical protein
MEEHAAPDADSPHTPPDGVGDALVDALGSLSQALETVVRARGRLYDFHQLTGSADLALGEAVRRLREAGATDDADLLDREILGRNVVPGMWTYQLVEAYDDTYYDAFVDLERRVRDHLIAGRRHVHEARMKRERRTPGSPHHR